MKKSVRLYVGQIILVFVSFSCGFRLFAAFNRGRLVELVFSQLAYYAVARAFSFKAS